MSTTSLKGRQALGRPRQLLARKIANRRLIDMDEHKSLLPALQEIPAGEGIEFWIGDAEEFEAGAQNHDLIYFSGFTPDELRRETIGKRGQGDRFRPVPSCPDGLRKQVERWRPAVTPVLLRRLRCSISSAKYQCLSAATRTEWPQTVRSTSGFIPWQRDAVRSFKGKRV
jgi:hypothetical protein